MSAARFAGVLVADHVVFGNSSLPSHAHIMCKLILAKPNI